ncbi:hypothetical protein GCM10027321_08320 [Massilia terrae]|uniref:EAL domain-containing protein n=1 Tax=Massilia terrae TaxID=1811224 RepID=A0ABT2D043_9BURK|nr:EAL domain-containing protein [Massilia terrae]MCS0659594.1 EAL domain-containing protein [Massilia terrae]
MALQSFRKVRRSLLALVIALPALYAVVAGLAIMRDYRSTIEQAESDMRNIATTLSEHAMRTFGEADIRLRAAITEIERLRLEPVPNDQLALHNILADAMKDAPQVAAIGVIAPDGISRGSGSVYPIAPFDNRDREYYSYLTTHHGSGTHIARPIKARSNGKWGIPLARRIDNPDGSLKMIVEIAVDMSYFDRIYRSLNLGEGSRLTLMRRDGWVIMATPMTPDALQLNLANSPVLARLTRANSGAFRNEDSVVDHRDRIIGYATVPESQVVAVATITSNQVLEPWLKRSGETATVAAVSSLLLLGLLSVLWIRLGELEETQAGLARRNEELDSARRRFQELVDGIDGIVWEALLPDFRFTYVSGNAKAISGYDAQEWMGDPHFWNNKLCCGADGKRVEPVLVVGSRGLFKPIEHRLQAPDGRELWLRSNVMVADSMGQLHVRGITVDITRQKRSEAQLFQAIHVDALTTLPNRHAFVESVGHALALAERNKTIVAIALIDVDNFNTLNDSLGHEAGDEMLVGIAERLHECLGPTDTLARMGGDEFAILIEDVDRVALKVEQLAERINAAFQRRIPADARELYVTVSMGIALYPQDGADYQALVRNADTALYRTKAAGRNNWQFFNSSMARLVEHRLDMETALRQALDKEEFRLVYQPQYSLQTDSIIGAEALLRWDRPGVGLIPTQEFIRVAEDSGLIVALGNWVLRTACCQAAAWHRVGFRVRIAVNVSVTQLRQADFVERVRDELAHSGLPPHCLELEITEGALISDIVEALDKLHEIKAMGVELAVDDFGTGYSSLSYLKQMPVDRLKVDQSFVRDIPSNSDDCAIVRAILAMASNLNLEVIAEGVESEPQMEFLRGEGCQEIQGFLLSPAVSADNFLKRFFGAGRGRAVKWREKLGGRP